MRDRFPDRLEKCRIREDADSPYLDCKPGDRYGRFIVRGPGGAVLCIVAAASDEWKECGFPAPAFEHVSVTVYREANGNKAARCPTWEEMAFVKDLCWDETECVLQYHPPRANYVNLHPFCLHLWKPVGIGIPIPPAGAIG